MREIQTEQSPRGGRRGGKQEDNKPAKIQHIRRGSDETTKVEMNIFIRGEPGSIQKNKEDAIPGAYYQLVAKPVLRAGHWAVFSLTSAH